MLASPTGNLAQAVKPDKTTSEISQKPKEATGKLDAAKADPQAPASKLFADSDEEDMAQPKEGDKGAVKKSRLEAFIRPEDIPKATPEDQTQSNNLDSSQIPEHPLKHRTTMAGTNLTDVDIQLAEGALYKKVSCMKM